MRISLAKREFAIQFAQKKLSKRVAANKLHISQGSISQLNKKYLRSLVFLTDQNQGAKE